MKLLKKLETDFKQINLNAPSLLYPKGKEKNLMLKLLTIFFFFVICMLLCQNVPALKHISPKIISQNN
jgi:hypothetical protein